MFEGWDAAGGDGSPPWAPLPGGAQPGKESQWLLSTFSSGLRATWRLKKGGEAVNPMDGPFGALLLVLLQQQQKIYLYPRGDSSAIFIDSTSRYKL